MNNNYCALLKTKDPKEAFRVMAGIYGMVLPDIAILDDESFPKYIMHYAFNLCAQRIRGIMTEKDWEEFICYDKNGSVSPFFCGSPFILWSEKLGAFYAYYFDVDIVGDVSDEMFENAYIELMDAYDFPVLVESVKKIAEKNKRIISTNSKKMQELVSKFSPLTRNRFLYEDDMDNGESV